MAKAKKRASKKKVGKTETIGFRLEPKLKFAADLAARKQRRSISSFIEWAVEQAVKSVTLKTHPSTEHDAPDSVETAHDAINYVWDVDEADRFVKFAMRYPELLTHEEEVLWKLIQLEKSFWLFDSDIYGINFRIYEHNIHFERIREYWEILKKVANEELSKDHLPSFKEATNT